MARTFGRFFRPLGSDSVEEAFEEIRICDLGMSSPSAFADRVTLALRLIKRVDARRFARIRPDLDAIVLIKGGNRVDRNFVIAWNIVR